MGQSPDAINNDMELCLGFGGGGGGACALNRFRILFIQWCSQPGLDMLLSASW